jgi:hypothetical protein
MSAAGLLFFAQDPSFVELSCICFGCSALGFMAAHTTHTKQKTKKKAQKNYSEQKNRLSIEPQKTHE